MSKRPLSSLRIGNFKAFGETQTIPIKPITLIFGPNSAGKSSIIHSLALAHEVHVREQYAWGAMLDVHRTDIGGSAIDLGGFKQFVHRSLVEKRVEWGVEISREAFDEDFRDHVQGNTFLVSATFGIANADGPAATGKSYSPTIESLEVSLDGEELIRLSRRETSDEGIVYLRVDRFSTVHKIFQQQLDFLEERAEQRGHRSASTDSRSTINALIDESLPQVIAHATGLLGFGLIFSPDAFRESQVASSLLDQRGAALQSKQADTLVLFWEGCEKFFSSIHSAVTATLSSLNYLGPLRELPPRNFSVGSYKDVDWRAGGGYAWDQVTKDHDVRNSVNLWLASSAKLKTPYRLDVKNLVALEDLHGFLWTGLYSDPHKTLATRENLERSLEDLKDALADVVRRDDTALSDALKLFEPWRERLESASRDQRESLIQEALADIQAKQSAVLDGNMEYTDEEALADFTLESSEVDAANVRATELMAYLRQSSIERQPKLVLHDIKRRTDVSHRDVGIGISQVLPVLVACFGSVRQVIAMEQPEIHLHPALQSELADVFIESALGENKNTFILETHSEHLILRLLRRIRETANDELPEGMTAIRPEDVSIIYVRPEGTSSKVEVMPVTSQGEFSRKWPDGFFTDREEELF